MDDLIQYNGPKDPYERRYVRSSGKQNVVRCLFRVLLPVLLALSIIGGAVWWGINSYQRSIEALDGSRSESSNDDLVADFTDERIDAVREMLPLLYGIIAFVPVIIVIMTVVLIHISRTSQPSRGSREVPIEEWRRRVDQYQTRHKL